MTGRPPSFERLVCLPSLCFLSHLRPPPPVTLAHPLLIVQKPRCSIPPLPPPGIPATSQALSHANEQRDATAYQPWVVNSGSVAYLIPNSNLSTCSCFKYHPNKQIFSHLEPASFTFPMKLYPTFARQGYPRPQSPKLCCPLAPQVPEIPTVLLSASPRHTNPLFHPPPQPCALLSPKQQPPLNGQIPSVRPPKVACESIAQ